MTGTDVLRLMRGTGLSFDEVAGRWPDPQGRIARGVAPHWRFDDEPETNWVLCLKHRPSDLIPGTSMCRFVAEERATGADNPSSARSCTAGVAAHCSVYESRPLTCRLFPFARTMDGKIHFPSQPEFGRTEPHDAYRLCPQPWNADEHATARLRAVFDQAVRDMDFFRGAAEVWNRLPRSWDLFPEFLELVEDLRRERELLRAAA